MKEVKVFINEGGFFEGLFVSPELGDCEIELIDLMTDSLERLDQAQDRLAEAEKRVGKGELAWIEY